MQPLVFDLFDTLLDESSIYKDFLLIILKKYLMKDNPEEFVKKFYYYQNKIMSERPYTSYKEITGIVFQELFINSDPGDVQILFGLYKKMGFLPGICDLMKKLEKRFDLYILTNIDNDLLDKINIPRKCSTNFKKIFTAEDNKVYKPHPKAYQIVADYIKLPKERIIFISSNDWDRNRAKELGFNAKSINDLKLMI